MKDQGGLQVLQIDPHLSSACCAADIGEPGGGHVLLPPAPPRGVEPSAYCADSAALARAMLAASGCAAGWPQLVPSPLPKRAQPC